MTLRESIRADAEKLLSSDKGTALLGIIFAMINTKTLDAVVSGNNILERMIGHLDEDVEGK